MSVLIDISHPAHVHFYRPVAEALMADRHPVHIVARDKDVAPQLLQATDLSFEILPRPTGEAGYVSSAGELVRRSLALRHRIRKWGARVVLTRNPSGVLAAIGTSATSIFDTDDGRAAGVHYWTARPFAGVVTSSTFDPESHGRKHRRYPALKAQMFIRRDPCSKNPSLPPTEQRQNPLFVVRFSAHSASHDSRVFGLNEAARSRLVDLLSSRGTVIVSSEGESPYFANSGTEFKNWRALDPSDFVALLSAADLVVSDSGSVSAEAALLGVPSIVYGSFVKSRFYIRELELRGLLRSFTAGDETSFFACVTQWADSHAVLGRQHRARLMSLEAETVDLAGWYVELVQSFL